MAKTPVKPAKTSKKRPVAAPRKLKKPVYQSFRLQKSIKATPIPSSFALLRQAFGVLARNWKITGGIVLIYGILNIVMVQGFSAAGDLNSTKDMFDKLFTGNFGQLVSGAGLFVYLLGSSGNTTSATAGTYQLFFVLLFSVVLIWVLRQIYAGNKVRIRDGFYRGVAPLISFVLVLVVIGLQMLPVVLGAGLNSIVSSNGIAASSIEQLLWALLVVVLGVVSLYMITSSLFALYIVTLPDMTPVRALRSARQLVQNRRWMVMRRIVFLPIALILLSAVVIIPLILFVFPIVPWAFFAATMLLLPIVHSYMYALYRALL